LFSFLILLLIPLKIAFSAPSDVFAVQAPMEDVGLTLKAIRSAKKSLKINIYEFNSSSIADAVEKKIDDGLHVEILLEGQPVGGMSAAEKAIRDRLTDSMRRSKRLDNHFYIMTAEKKKDRRYAFNHAKYTLVDDESVLVGSENYSGVDPKGERKKGNRGWETWIEDENLLLTFRNTFAKDTDLSFGDVIDWARKQGTNLGLLTDYLLTFAKTPAEMFEGPVTRSTERPAGLADAIEPIFSPNTSEAGLIKLINNAQYSIDLELMTFSPQWGNTGKNSPLFEAVVAAARRGVKVRALLNDEAVFGGSSSNSTSHKNEETITNLLKIANKEGLKIEGKIVDVKKLGIDYIHNKGALIDGNKTLISSINWNQNSVQNNREAAVIISGEELTSYYQALFEKDWSFPGKKF
jgi:phosphatidylserine/phosphatidylglycerophosphate/cardiolipin synthase-like enzyme